MHAAAFALAALLAAGGEEKPTPAAADAPPILKVTVLGPVGDPLPDATVLAGIWTEQPGFKATRKYQTDASGVARVELPRTYTIVRLWASKPPLVTLFANWEQKELEEGRGLPDRYTFRLERGVPAGGRVVDEDGKPVAGAKVEVTVANEAKLGAGDSRVRYDTGIATGDDAVTTDADGRWRIASAPAGPEAELRVSVSHPDYVPGQFRQQSQKDASVTAATLRDGTATFALKRGVAMRGRVMNAAGDPVEGAIVLSNNSFHPPHARTDADGRYTLPVLAPQTTTLAVVAPGFAPQFNRVELRPGMPPYDVRLEPGKTARLRIVDAAGAPVPSAIVGPKSQTGGTPLDTMEFARIDHGIPRKPDANGIWAWTWAPDEPVHLEVGAKGFAVVEVDVAGGQPDQTVVLKPQHRVTGRVTDAVTGESIPAFTVIQVDVFRPDLLHAERQNAIKGTAGRLDFLVHRADIPIRLRIEAPGYRTQTGREFRKGDDAARSQDFRLQPSPPVFGVVTDAQGRPVPNAEVLLATPTQSADPDDVSEILSGNAVARTAADGRFAFPHPGEPWAVVARSDRGTAQSAEFSPDDYDAGTLSLRPWASVRGRFSDGGRPVSGASVSLRPIRIESLERPQIDARLHAVTDAEGRFEFPKVPPGPCAVSVFLGPWKDEGFRSGPCAPLDLAPGEARELELGAPGATLAGKVTLTGKVPADLDCNYSLNYLVSRKPAVAAPPEVAALGFDLADGWQEAWPNTREGHAFLDTLPHWFVKLAPDGSFRVSGVPAGDYLLAVAVYAKPAGCLIDPLARKTIPVKVTEADVARGEITLPDVTAEVEPVPMVGDVPSLAFRLPDGPDATLADRRGRLTLIQFWASWCGPCKAQIPALRRLHERFADRGLDVLGLSLDDEDEAWRAALTRSDFPGRQGRLKPEPNAGVSGVPACWLLDAEGKIVAKGYTPDELAPTIAEQLEAAAAPR